MTKTAQVSTAGTLAPITRTTTTGVGSNWNGQMNQATGQLTIPGAVTSAVPVTRVAGEKASRPAKKKVGR